jgi:hypothetical protein
MGYLVISYGDNLVTLFFNRLQLVCGSHVSRVLHVTNFFIQVNNNLDGWSTGYAI